MGNLHWLYESGGYRRLTTISVQFSDNMLSATSTNASYEIACSRTSTQKIYTVKYLAYVDETVPLSSTSAVVM